MIRTSSSRRAWNVVVSSAALCLTMCGPHTDGIADSNVQRVQSALAATYAEPFDTANSPAYPAYLGTTGDWAYGDFKGQCAVGDYATGLSATAIGMRADLREHSMLCVPHQYYLMADQTSPKSEVRLLSGADDRGDVATGDWDVGFIKAECAEDEAIAGISQTGNAALNADAVLCGYMRAGWRSVDSQCTTLVFSNTGADRLSTASGDWAPGYSKNECRPDQVMKGVSRDGTGQPHAILCCNASNAEACATPAPNEVATFKDGNYGSVCRVFDEHIYDTPSWGLYYASDLAPMPNDAISSLKIRKRRALASLERRPTGGNSVLL